MNKSASAQESLDTFGRLMIEGFRDKALRQLLGFDAGKWQGPQDRDLQNAYLQLPKGAREVVKRMAEEMLLTSLHDGLASIQESHDLQGRLRILVDGIDVIRESGMLNGELFGENGWIARFSAYPLASTKS